MLLRVLHAALDSKGMDRCPMRKGVAPDREEHPERSWSQNAAQLPEDGGAHIALPIVSAPLR